jgi:hypothetical protein
MCLAMESITGAALIAGGDTAMSCVYAMFILCVSLCVRADTVTEHSRASKYNPCTLAPEECSDRSDDGAESLGDATRCDWESSAVTCWAW